MTEHNIFDEAKEEYERQKMEALWKQYGIWVVIVALGIVLATATSTAYRSWKIDHDQKITNDFVAAAKPGADNAKSITALQQFADANGGTNQAAFALLKAGALAADQNDNAKAVTLFDKVEADDKADIAFRQLGTLLSVEAQLDSGDITALDARLQPLAVIDATWHYSALQDEGYLAIRAKDTAKAKEIFTILSQDARAPQSIMTRASDILRSLK